MLGGRTRQVDGIVDLDGVADENYDKLRFKGLEYQRMIIAGVADGLVPREVVNRLRGTDPVRHRREIQRARSSLFVAATRARDSVDVFWHGKPSPFLDTSWGAASPMASTR